MTSNLYLQLRRLGEKKEIDHNNLREKLLRSIANVCYQNGDIKSVNKYKELCYETTKYMNKLFKEATKVVFYSKKHMEPIRLDTLLQTDLSLAIDVSSEKPKIWVKGLRKAIINNRILDEETITSMPLEEAIPMMLLKIVEPLTISMFFNQEKKNNYKP